MGFFSWLTADSKESIYNCYCERCEQVYLLQPGSKPNIEETNYGGYGEFGGVDAYIWLAKHNLPIDILVNMNEEEMRSAGISVAFCVVYEDKITGKFWTTSTIACCSLGSTFNLMPGMWNQPIDGIGLTNNEAVESGRFIEREDKKIEIKYPLKFSFDKDAVYEDLPASKDCPIQGHFGTLEEQYAGEVGKALKESDREELERLCSKIGIIVFISTCEYVKEHEGDKDE